MFRSLAVVLMLLVVLVVPVQAQLFPTAYPSAAPETAAPMPADLSQFVGGWFGHGRGLMIDSTGHAEYRYRTYTWCTPGMTAPCDWFEGNFIQSGGSADFTFTSVEGRTLYGRIDRAADPTRFPKGDPVRFEVGEHNVAELTWGDAFVGPGITLCGAWNDVRWPPPCGA